MPNKPTTLREEIKDLVEQFMSSNDQEMYKNEFIKDILSLLTSHNKELLQKIEGMKVPINNLTRFDLGKPQLQAFNEAIDEVISIIETS